MPTRYWELAASPGEDMRTKESLRFTLYCVGQGQQMPLVRDVSLAELTEEITLLENGLHEIRAQAEKAWEQVPHEESPGTVNQENEPAQVWARLAACSSHQELQETFNNLPDKVRRDTAEYVLSTVNMFAGAGAFFAQNYDHSTAFLE
ncbi:MAG: hypothetical protein U5L00_08720 [Desulfovermiculus sp.]|nr:hypothetical protein [Desulfovermiculus sp.]